MKKRLILIMGVVVISGLLTITSCASEDVAGDDTTATTVKLTKTPEMLNFEQQLKLYFSSKSSNNQLTKGEDVEKETIAVAQKLMASIGKEDTTYAKKAEQTTDEYIRMVMKEYSNTLTEMYNQLKAN